MDGYKGFYRDERGLYCDPDGQSRFDYEEGRTYYHTGPVVCCQSGFHYCRNSMDVIKYYGVDDNIVYHRIYAESEIIEEEYKCVCSVITIYDEVSFAQLHQEMPSYIKRTNGTQEWYLHGRLHREDEQPAVICTNGRLEWYSFGRQYVPFQINIPVWGKLTTPPQSLPL